MLLNPKLPRILPLLILKREEHDLRTTALQDTLDGRSLVLYTRARNAIAFTRRRPARFHDIHFFPWTHGAQLVDLRLDERSRVLGFGVRVEECVEICGYDVDDVTPC